MRGPLVRVPLCGSLLSASRRSQGEMPFEKIERRGHHSFVNTLQQDGLGRIPVVKEVVDEPDDDSLLFHAARWRDGGSDVSPGATESSTDSCLQDAAQSAHMDVREEVIRLISDMLQTAHIHTQRGHQRGTCSGLIATTLPGLIKFGAHFKEAGVVSPAHTQAHVVRWRPWWPPGHPQRAARARWGLELAQHFACMNFRFTMFLFPRIRRRLYEFPFFPPSPLSLLRSFPLAFFLSLTTGLSDIH